MKISVISPSFNQAQFLPHNLRTVSGQQGVELEHILVDPGSTDGSLELARAARHAILIAEPDRGQSHGITKGFQRATGDILCWLNSDDMYPGPDTLRKVVDTFAAHPEADIVYGGVDFVDENGAFLRKGFVNRNAEGLLKSFHQQVGIVQPGVFWRRKVFDHLGGPSEDYTYCMDYEYWVRMADAGFKWVYLDEVLAHHRWWPGMKTSSGRGDSLIEHFRVGQRYFGYIHWKWIDRYAEYRATDADGVVHHADTIDETVKAGHARQTIERFVTQDMLAVLERSEDPDHVETRAYIRRMAPGFGRVFYGSEDLPGLVYAAHPDPHAEQRVAWHIFDARVPGRPTGFKSYRVPDNFTRHVDADWYEAQRQHAARRMAELSARRKEVCIVVANGPSLNQSNFDHLQHADVILSNFAIINAKLRQSATYLTVVNDLVARQGSVDFNRLDIPRLMPFWLGNSINAGENTVFLPATVKPEFCTEPDGLFSWRATVSFFNMQLAYALGYEKVALIGFDHYFKQAPERKEGDAIEQKEEDPNHFDPRYFKGKTWQAADTDNMEKMYEIARQAYDAGGRQIVNSTVGGRLEVFPRVPLEQVLGLTDPTTARYVPLLPSSAPTVPPATPAPTCPAPAPAALPRLLVIDMTAMGDGSATGEVKATLLQAWPADRVLQIACPGRDRLALVRKDNRGGFDATDASLAQIDAALAAFAPEAILCRPLANWPHLHDLMMQLVDRLDLPLVTWIMDDWPERLAHEDPATHARMEADLRHLLARSSLRLSICEAMSVAFEARYGHPFVAYANAIDPALWPAGKAHAPEPLPGSLVVRYAGGLAADMNLQTVLSLAETVETLARAGREIRLEINTQPWWASQSGPLFQGFTATRLDTQTFAPAEYRAWLQAADVLLIAYNFDAASIRYVRYSMANKMPECLASGAATLVIGPRDVATVDYLADTGAVEHVATADTADIAAALERLADPARRQDLAERARQIAITRHNLPDEVRRFAADLRIAAATAVGSPVVLWQHDRAANAFRPAPLLAPQAVADPVEGLLVFRRPETVVAQAIQAGRDAPAALAAWCARATRAVDLLRRHRRHLFPVLEEDLAAAPGPLVARLARQFGTSDIRSLVPPVPHPSGAPGPIVAALAVALVRQHAEAPSLAGELLASSLPGAAAAEDLWSPADLPAALKQLQAFHALQRTKTELVEARAALEDRVARQAGRIRALEAELDRIYQSKSWRLTEPLRGLRRTVGPSATQSATKAE